MAGISDSTNSSPSSFGLENSLIGEVIGRFEKIRILGSGTFGKAWLVKSLRSQKKYVIKELIVRQDGKDKTINEVDILKSCYHFNIIRYKEFFYGYTNDPGDSVLYMVMEYADGGDLHLLLNNQKNIKKIFLEESKIRNWFVQISLALNYLHKEMKILHRDLKTHNIFVMSHGILKLGDFGISRTLSNENEFATTGIGTPQYLSPEMCKSQPYNYKSDIWSLGCILYEMCSLEPAFSGNDLPLLIKKIIGGTYKPLPNHYSHQLKDLAKVLFKPDPEKRPSAEQILTSNMFLKEVNHYLKFMKENTKIDSNGSVSSLDKVK